MSVQYLSSFLQKAVKVESVGDRVPDGQQRSDALQSRHHVIQRLFIYMRYTRNTQCGPGLSVVFRWLVRLGSFPVCWTQANVAPIPKDPPSSSVANYRPIS